MTQPDDTPMVSVPREPTEAMLQGGCAKHKPGQPMSDRPGGDRECPTFVRRRQVWADMIAAHEAASPPLAEGGRDDLDALIERFERAFRANIYDHPHKKLSGMDEHTVSLFATVAAEALSLQGN